MRYIVSIVCPPLAVALCGRPISAILNLGLTLLFWAPGAIHAFAVVAATKADEQCSRMLHTIDGCFRAPVDRVASAGKKAA